MRAWFSMLDSRQSIWIALRSWNSLENCSIFLLISFRRTMPRTQFKGRPRRIETGPILSMKIAKNRISEAQNHLDFDLLLFVSTEFRKFGKSLEILSMGGCRLNGITRKTRLGEEKKNDSKSKLIKAKKAGALSSSRRTNRQFPRSNETVWRLKCHSKSV